MVELGGGGRVDVYVRGVDMCVMDAVLLGRWLLGDTRVSTSGVVFSNFAPKTTGFRLHYSPCANVRSVPSGSPPIELSCWRWCYVINYSTIVPFFAGT